MKRILFSLILAFPLVATANNELNNADVTAKRGVGRLVDPNAQSVIIEFNKDGVPVSVAHTSEKAVKTTELAKLKFAQLALSAENPKALNESTPASELNDAQGTPQFGFWGGGVRGGFIYRGPNGGVIAGGGRAWGGGWNGGYGGGGWAGGYPYGYGYGYGYAGGYANVGWGCNGYGYGCGNYAPQYYYNDCNYAAVGFYGGGYGGNYYGLYQPSLYY